MRRGGWIAVGGLLLVALVTMLGNRYGTAAPAPPDVAQVPSPVPVAAPPKFAVTQGEADARIAQPTPIAAAAEAEWTRAEDLEQLVRDEPAGTLGVVVLRGRRAVADARVRVWAEAARVGNAAQAAATTPWAE